MKTISKILSVVLCLAMVVGFFTFGAAAESVTGTLVTDAATVKQGGTFVLVANYGGEYWAMNAEVAAKPTATKISAPSNNQVSGDLPVWTVAATGNGISLAVGANYLTHSSKTNFASGSSPYEFTLTANSNGSFQVFCESTRSSGTQRALAFQDNTANTANSYRFAPYGTTQNDDIYSFDIYFYQVSAATGGNTGSGNTGSGNTGSGNTGSGNTGSGNTGSGNTGSGSTTTAQLPPVTTPVAGTTYKFGMYQVTNGKTVYIDGSTDKDRFLTTTTDKSAALDVTVEASGDGFKFATTVSGSKVYITASLNSEEKTVLSYTAEGSVFKFDATVNSWTIALDGTDYYIGSYSDFDTMSLSKLSYITTSNAGISQFPAGFFTVDSNDNIGTGGSGNTGSGNTGSTTTSLVKVETPVAGTAYKLMLVQGNKNVNLFFTGTEKENQPWYILGSESEADAVDVYLEAVTGGYRLYFMAGTTKTYVDMHKDGTHYSLKLTTTPSAVYTWNAEHDTLVTTVEDADCYIGTYSTYTTFSCNKMEKIADSFVAHFYTESTGNSGSDNSGNTGSGNTGSGNTGSGNTGSGDKEEDKKPAAPVIDTGVKQPTAGSSFKFGMYQENLKKYLYFNGKLDSKGYYLDSTENYAEAVDVTVEATTGGYYLYFMNGTTKTYIEIYVTDTGYVNMRLVETPTTVYTWNAEHKTFTAKLTVKGAEVDHFISTYKEYTTFSGSDLKYISTSFAAHLYADEPAPTADTSVISVAIAAAVLSVLGTTALVMKKKEF